jgi:hypothetical protein
MISKKNSFSIFSNKNIFWKNNFDELQEYIKTNKLKFKSKIDLKKEYTYKKYLIEFNHKFSEIYISRRKNQYFGANYFLNYKGKINNDCFGTIKSVIIGGFYY